MKSNLKRHDNKVVFFPIAEEKRTLKLVAVPVVHEGIIHAMFSATVTHQDVPEVWRWPRKMSGQFPRRFSPDRP